MERGGGSRLLQMQSRDHSRSWDSMSWWRAEQWLGRRADSGTLRAADPGSIRNGWLTLEPEARFQQKQMAERELKIASLYEAQQARALDRVHRSPASTTSSSPGVQHERVPPGKVRQMFEERRTKGIDKSYPLQPIQNTDRSRKPANGVTKVTTSHTTNSNARTRNGNVEKRTSNVNGVNGARRKNDQVNGSGDLNHNNVTDINHNKRLISNHNGSGADELDGELLENETFPEALAPEPTPRSPEPKKPPRRSPAVKKTVSPPPVAPPRRVASENVAVNKPREPMRKANPVQSRQSVAASKSRAPAAEAVGGGGGGAGEGCAVCGRHFAADRLAKHEDICRKAANKKRKPFDALKHRLAGTEAEQFIPKLRKAKAAPAAAAKTSQGKTLNSSWRKKHEEFINAIRAAKGVQAHLKAGGKLSDLPPPPPSENPDYVQCPHCQRRFNQAAAERHIPKCKDFQFNKPKPGARRR